MSLRNVNLNLLPILQALLKTGSVSRAAAALRLSQPAVSDALARLRVIVKDQLLVRIGGEMKLTSRATEMIGPLEELCGSLQLFFSPDDSEPGSTTRELVIASSDVCGYLMVREVLALLRDEAPGTTLHLIEIDAKLCERMASREIDFALLPEFALEDLAPAPLRFLPLLPIDHTVLMWKDHPLATKAQLEPSDLLAYPHIIFQPDAVITDPSRITFPWGGMEFRVSARVGQMLLIPHLLVGTDALSILTRQIGVPMMAHYPLAVRDTPYPSERTALGLMWSPVYDADPFHKWFRNSMATRMDYSNLGQRLANPVQTPELSDLQGNANI